MHAILALEVAVGKVALDADGDALDAGFVTVDEVLDGGLVAMALTPSQIHAHEHGCPVLALGASGAGVDLEDGVHLVLVVAQHVAQLEFLEHRQRLAVESVEFVFLDEAFLDKVKTCRDLVDGEFYFLAAVNPVTQGLDFLHLCLGGLLVLPEVGHMGAEFLFLDLDLFPIDVEISFQVFFALLQFFELFLSDHYLMFLVPTSGLGLFI